MLDWNIEKDTTTIDKTAQRFITNKNHWERSTSEPDLTENFNQRFQIKHPHEYISVDELKYFRRKKPTDCHTKSNICLYDQDQPELPFSIFKTEYKWRYKDPLLFLRPGLTRKATSLKLEGSMDIETEHKAKYLPYNTEQILRGRPPALRNPENLILHGDFEHNPEYKSSFVHHPTSVRQRRYSPLPNSSTFQIHGEIDLIPQTSKIHQMPSPPINNPISQPPQPPPQPPPQSKSIDCLPAGLKNDMQKCHLKLEGEMSYMPEYRSQYIPYNVEKSHSIPQLSNIKFNGIFGGLAEYEDNYKFYDHYSKSAPIKKLDHLILNGQIETYPEYRDQYKEPNKNIKHKSELLKTDDHEISATAADVEFSKDQPEYLESFQDPQVKNQMPERGKCREPYLRLKGKIEFNPEYRSTYLDYPRSRPICKKSTSSFRINGNTNANTTTSHIKSPFNSPRKRYQSNSPLSHNKYHDPNQDLPFPEKPEYRKAQYIYQIRERTPKNTRQVAEIQGVIQSPKKHTLDSVSGSRFLIHDTDDDQKNSKGFEKRLPTTTRRRRDTNPGGTSINNNLGSQNIVVATEMLSSKKSVPKYGRRASLTRNSKNNRDKSSIIEGNPKYYRKNMNNNKSDDSSSSIIVGGETPITTKPAHQHKNDSSFVVLHEPCKQNKWMKKSWYEN